MAPTRHSICVVCGGGTWVFAYLLVAHGGKCIFIRRLVICVSAVKDGIVIHDNPRGIGIRQINQRGLQGRGQHLQEPSGGATGVGRLSFIHMHADVELVVELRTFGFDIAIHRADCGGKFRHDVSPDPGVAI